MKINIRPNITQVENGKPIKRYNANVFRKEVASKQKVNIGVTPQGSFYYRVMALDKSWGSLYMTKHDGSELIVDTVKISDGKKGTVVLRDSSKKILSDKRIHHSVDDFGVKNDISLNVYQGEVSSAYVQDEAYKMINSMKKSLDTTGMKPIKRGFISKLVKFLKK